MSSDAVSIPNELAKETQRIAGALIDAGSGAWATMTGSDVACHTDAPRYGPASTLSEGLGAALATEVAWSGDREGKLFLLVSETGAKAIIAHMMALMMGTPPDIDATQLDTEGLDAYAEAAASFMGQGAQALRGELGGTIKLTVVRTARVASPDEAAALFGEALWTGMGGGLTLADAGPFPMAVWMEPSLTGVALPDAAPKAVDPALSRYAPENVAHAMNVPVPLIVILAEKKMRMELIQEMAPGTIIEFKKQSGEILDVCANNVKIAEAEVVTTNQHFGVQLQRMVDPRPAPKE